MDKSDVRILVVDDDRQLAELLAEHLKNLGYQATLAFDGVEALEHFSHGDFPLVITDMVMPRMDGLELTVQIKALDAKAVVIVITGQGSIETAVSAMKKGAYDFFRKPFKAAELKVVIERAVEHYILSSRLGVFRGLSLALIISVPVWLAMGIALGLVWR